MEKLKTENPNNDRAALRAFFKQRNVKPRHRPEFGCFFEHGQLWIQHNPSGAQWSVVDAEGGPAVNGFDFERVSIGDEIGVCWTGE